MAQDSRKEESELRPTSSPPDDVDIPTESIYGSNEALEPIESEGSTPKEAHTTNTPESTVRSSEIGQKNKSIQIGWLPFLLFLLLLGGGLFILGSKIGTELYPEKPKGEPGANSQTEKPRRTVNFIRDSGIYKKENEFDDQKLARLRLSKARSSILWITSEPNNQSILRVLQEAKDAKGLPIVIVTGADTSNERIKEARSKGFVVNKIKDSLELPYSFLIVDSKLIMDISRKHWLWETTDKDIVKDTGKWLQDITKDAVIAK
jgi:hypothetical protein